MDDGYCQGKEKFSDRATAKRAARRSKGRSFYWCSTCRTFHVSGTRFRIPKSYKRSSPNRWA